MRIQPLAAAVLLVGLAPVLAACGDQDAEAGDVPTIVATPSTPESSSAPVAPAESSDAPSITTPATSSSATHTEPSSAPSTPSASESGSASPSASKSASAPAEAGDGPPTTYDAAEARVDALLGSSGPAERRVRFSTPNDVVYCVLASDYQRPACELRTGTIPDPDVCASALGDNVGRVEITPAGRAVALCNTDTIREPGAGVVPPDAVVAGGDLECAVEGIGVTCVDRDRGVGFFLGQGEYHLLGG